LKLLLTSAGVTNPSIRAALLELLGKPIEDYAIDDETAIKVVDGVAHVISEGHWRLFDT